VALPKIADLTTDSMEAYNYFLRGRNDVDNLMAPDAKKSLEKAITLDPAFAIAYLYLSDAEYQLVDWRARDEALKKAKEYSGRASEKERLYIEAQYASVIERNPEKKRRILLDLTEKYPQEKHAHYELGGFYYPRGQYAEAISEYERAIALDPMFGPAFNMLGYSYTKAGEFDKAEAAFIRYIGTNPGDPNPVDSLAELYLCMGRLDQAEARYREAMDLKKDFDSPCRGLAFISALREDYGATYLWLEEFKARSTPTGRMEVLWHASLYDYLLGRLEKSLAGYLGLRKIGESFGQDYVAATVDWICGFIYSDLGRFAEARKAIQAFEEYYRRRGSEEFRPFVVMTRGWADFREGRLGDARARLAEIEPLLPNAAAVDRDEIRFKHQLLGAEVALTGGSASEAVAAAERLRPPAFPGMNTGGLAPYLIPLAKDVLARAYWKNGDLDKAEAEYRRLMTVDPSNRIRYLIHPLYHYRLGRVLEEKGDRTGAAEEYRKFLAYWKDADPIFPETADARKRLAAFGSAPR